MTVVNPKSISGITSITTASGSDNLLTIHTSDANNTERLRIDSTGTTKIVTGIVTTLTATTGIVTTLTANTVTSLGDLDIADTIVHTGDTNTKIRFPAADTITAETGGNERFRITSGGLIGINTGSPTARLEIVESKIKTWTPSSQTELLVERSGNCIVSIVGNNDSNCQLAFGDDADENVGNIDYDHANDSMTFRTNASERLRITSDGKIGINVTTPQKLLDVRGEFAISNNNASYWDFDRDDSDGSLKIKDTGTERLRIASDGKIGISTVTPNARLHILSGNEAGILIEDNDTGNNAPYLEIMAKRTDGNTHQSFSGQVFLSRNRTEQKVNSGLKLGTILFGGNHTNASKSNIRYAASIAGMSSGDFNSANDMPTDLVFFTGSTGRAPTVANVSSGTERLRIGSDGKIEVAQNGAYMLFKAQGDFLVPAIFQNTGNNVNKTMIEFRGWNDSTSGTISTRVNVTTYSTSSDARLKENIVDTSNGIERVKQLRPVQFNFIANKEETMDGFLAQEAKNVVPVSVTGDPDEVDKDGKMVPMGMDNSKLVPILTKALQESITKIETLESKVAALEGS